MNTTDKASDPKSSWEVRVHLWLNASEQCGFGLGRMLLLEAIQTKGSLKAAAEGLGMSYRGAWGKIKASEEALGQPLIEKKAGNRHGYDLTTFGINLLQDFKSWFADVEAYAVKKAADYLSLPTKAYKD